MKINLFLFITLISINISFSQNLLMEADVKIQRFGKDIYYKDSNDKLLEGDYKIADKRGNYTEVTFVKGQKEGKSTKYNYKGKVIIDKNFLKGKGIGKYITYHDNGKVYTKGQFVDGEQDGKWVNYGSKGKVTSIEFYKNGKKTGKWERFDKKGKIRAIEYYLEDKKTGKWWSKKYYPQYQTYSYLTENYKNNRLFGYAEDKREDGTLKWERNYKEPYTYTHKGYHPNGKPALVYTIDESRYDGEMIEYRADGSVLSTKVYKLGQLVKASKNFETTRKTAATTATKVANTQSNSVKKRITDFNYKALLISNANYINDVVNLDLPTVDAEKLSAVLLDKYSFEKKDIVHLKDATRYDIINTLDSLAANITSNDNLLIFYAGHGVFDENLNKGYWIPVDATVDKKNNWVSNSDIIDYIAAIKSQHTLLISDACFSGSIFEYKNRDLNPRGQAITDKLINRKSRKAMTSGLNKTVPDVSVFIKYLIKSLNENTKPYLRAGELYNDIREAVMANTDNNPQFEVIKNVEHEGGEFIFLKKDAAQESKN